MEQVPTIEEFREIEARAKANGPIDIGIATALLQFAPTTEESRDWARVPQEIREKTNLNLPSYESIMAIRRLGGNIPDYVRIALTYLAVCRPSKFWRIYREAQPVKYHHLHSVTGELVAIPVFPYFVGWHLHYYARLGYKQMELLTQANDSIAEIDTYFQQLFLDRDESRKAHRTTEEVDAEDDRDEKFPYQKVGSEYQVALMRATYGDCSQLRYAEWMALLYYAGEVKGL